jgi:hypothetical protein
MQIKEQPESVSPSVRAEDFNFVYSVIDELRNVPKGEKIHFPLPGRSGVYADVECKIDYDRDSKPFGEFTVLTRQYGLIMNHKALIRTLVTENGLRYELQVKAAGKHYCRRDSLITTHRDAKAVALAICRTYHVGSSCRRIVPLKS